MVFLKTGERPISEDLLILFCPKGRSFSFGDLSPPTENSSLRPSCLPAAGDFAVSKVISF
jgi:hypothetical protein